MINILKILFGRGWYVLLYLVSYFWYFIFPGMFVGGYMKESWQIAKEGGDHSGGLGMMMPLIFTPIVLVPVLMISSVLWMTTFSYGLWTKIFIVIGISIVIPIIVALIGMSMSNKIYYFLYYLGYFGLFAFHLFMLHKFIINK